jgi:hypothetical protein
VIGIQQEKNIEKLFSLLNLMKGDKLLMVVKWRKKRKTFSEFFLLLSLVIRDKPMLFVQWKTMRNISNYLPCFIC